jgi:CheY-like chemotaxis protein
MLIGLNFSAPKILTMMTANLEITVSPRRVVIVDDDNDLLITLKHLLERHGYVVNISHNGEQIREIIKLHKPDIILMDINMEGIDGSEICKELRKHDDTKNIPIIMISAHHEVAQIAQLCGANGHLSKPFQVENLIKKISSFINKTS